MTLRRRILRMGKWFAYTGLIFIFLSGCAGDISNQMKMEEQTEHGIQQESQQQIQQNLSIILSDIYTRAEAENTSDSIEITGVLMDRLGEKGYAVSDQYNQADMKNPELLRDFCGKVEENGSFQYVSNRVTEWSAGTEPEWYAERAGGGSGTSPDGT